MTAVRRQKCRICFGELPAVAPGATSVRCVYCGKTWDVDRSGGSAGSPEVARPSSGSVAAVLAIAGLLVAAAGALAVYALRGPHVAPEGSTPAARESASPPGETAAPAAPPASDTGDRPAAGYLYDTFAGPPIPIDVDHDGIEDFVGRIRERSARGNDDLYIVAWRGKDLSEAYRAGPYGTYSAAHRSVLFSAAGSRLVVTDAHAVVHMLNMTTGQEVASGKTADLAKALCVVDNGSKVVVKAADGSEALADPSSGSIASPSAPIPCTDNFGSPCRAATFGALKAARCAPRSKYPSVAGFTPHHMLTEGGIAVVSGAKSPGTAIPLAVGYVGAGVAPAWQGPIPGGDVLGAHAATVEFDDLAGGRYVAPYELANGDARLAAFDARTGTRQWDVALVGRMDGLRLTRTRAYVLTGAATLEVFDASTGDIVGRVGMH